MEFLLTCLLRGMTDWEKIKRNIPTVSTHMPLARHDCLKFCAGKVIRMFLLTCLLRGMTRGEKPDRVLPLVSTHMPLARHDKGGRKKSIPEKVSTHMPLARHDDFIFHTTTTPGVSTHMPLARHDGVLPIWQRPIAFLLTCLLRGMTRDAKASLLLARVSSRVPVSSPEDAGP